MARPCDSSCSSRIVQACSQKDHGITRQRRSRQDHVKLKPRTDVTSLLPHTICRNIVQEQPTVINQSAIPIILKY